MILIPTVNVFSLTEDRHLNTLPSASSSMLPSPADPGAEPITPGPSLPEQDLQEGTHTHTYTHSQLTLSCSLLVPNVRCIYSVFACCQMYLTDTCWAPLTAR